MTNTTTQPRVSELAEERALHLNNPDFRQLMREYGTRANAGNLQGAADVLEQVMVLIKKHVGDHWAMGYEAGKGMGTHEVNPSVDLLTELANKGGVIVGTASLNTAQIAAARIEGRMYVREDGCGFVHAHPALNGGSPEPYRQFVAEWSTGWEGRKTSPVAAPEAPQCDYHMPEGRLCPKCGNVHGSLATTASQSDADKMLAMRAEYDRQDGPARGMLMGRATTASASGDKCSDCQGDGFHVVEVLTASGVQETGGPCTACDGTGRASAPSREAAVSLGAVLNCYSPDDAVGDYQDKIRQLFAAQAVHPGADEVLRLFMGAAYPVALEINPRGYNWCEAYLDQARAAAMSAATEKEPK